MIQYLATINTPGYSPMDDDPPLFDTPREAWDYLAGERERAEDELADSPNPYSETHARLVRFSHGAATPLEMVDLDATECGSVFGDTVGYNGNHDLGQVYSVSLVVTDATPAEVWPHVKPRVVTVGKGLKTHGSLGVTTGCGKVWTHEVASPTEGLADSIDCQRCITAIDERNAWNRSTSYGASASFENESFGYGVDHTKATEWRVGWYATITTSLAARKTLKIIPTRPARGANR